MSPVVERRIAEIERLVAEVERAPADHRPDPHSLSDAEAVEEYRRLNHALSLLGGGDQRPRRKSPDEEAAIVAMWREMTS